MKPLSIRFDTEKVNKDLKWIKTGVDFTSSEIARAAMNIGLFKLNGLIVSKPDSVARLIEINK